MPSCQIDGQWTLQHNLQLLDCRKDDIDAPLVGPLGICALEVKNLGSKNRWDGKTWTRWIEGEWQEIEWHPLEQTRQNVERLQANLNETMETSPPNVDYRLVWVSGEGHGWRFRPKEPRSGLFRPRGRVGGYG